MSGLHALARMNTATTGPGSVTLSTAVSGFLTFAQAKVADGEEVSYGIRDGANSEVGRGVVGASGTTLTRSVVASTNSNNPISLSGTAQVFITALAEDFSRVAAPNKPGVTMTKHGNLAQLVCAPNDFNLRDLPPAVQYDGDVVISRGGLVFTSVTSNINARIGPLTLSTLGSTRVTLDTSGNLGIGLTPSGSFKLEVSGKLSVVGATGAPPSTPAAPAFRVQATTNSVLDFGNVDASPFGNWIQSRDKAVSSTYYPLLLNPNGGNVGIGNTNPGAALDVTGTTNISGLLTLGSGATNGFTPTLAVLHGTGAYVSVKSGTNPEIIFGSDATTYGIFGTFSNHSVGFRTNNTLKMTLDTSGNLGIGLTPSGSFKLEVSGKLSVVGATGAPPSTPAAPAFRVQATTNSVLDFGNVDASPFGNWIQSRDKGVSSTYYPLLLNPNGGNVGIGNTNPGAALDVTGSVTASGIVTFSNTTASTTTTTGALVVSGGLGVAGAINGGGALTASGLVTFSNTTDATSTATGAIQTSGGLGVVKNIWCGGSLGRSVTTGITGTGTTQAGAVALTSDLNIVNGTAGGGVRLPTAVVGMDITVRNTVSVGIYPATGAQINSQAANTVFSPRAPATTRFVAVSTTQWITA